MTASTPFDDGATTNTGENRENLSWQQFGDASRELAQQIVNSGWMPDLIVAIARGGLIPAAFLCTGCEGNRHHEPGVLHGSGRNLG